MFNTTWRNWRESRAPNEPHGSEPAVAFDLLEFRTREDPSSNYWEGPVPFSGPSTIDLWLEAGEHGPTDQQREHYRDLVGRFDEVASTVWPELGRAYEEWFNRRLPVPPDRWFEPALLKLPCDGRLGEWELAFTARDCPQFLFSAIMSGWRCVDVAVLDGRLT